jgi:transcriptional regulator
VYVPPLFHERDEATLFALVDANPFATVVCVNDGAPEIAHVPVLLDRATRRLVLHVAAGNPMAALAKNGARMTTIFHGPHAYVSPNFYRDPKRNVPTWSYAVVHVEGGARVLDRDATMASLDRLARTFEGDRDGAWRLADAAPEYVAGLARGLVAFEIAIATITGKVKMSQNRPREDRPGVVSGLLARGDENSRAVAEWTRRILES